jgi:hypothetical protein
MATTIISFPSNSAKRSVKLIKNSELKMIPGSPHCIVHDPQGRDPEARLPFISQRH